MKPVNDAIQMLLRCAMVYERLASKHQEEANKLHHHRAAMTNGTHPAAEPVEPMATLLGEAKACRQAAEDLRVAYCDLTPNGVPHATDRNES